MSDVVERNLEHILIRIREGDKRKDWLPVIERLAQEALNARVKENRRSRPGARGPMSSGEAVDPDLAPSGSRCQ